MCLFEYCVDLHSVNGRAEKRRVIDDHAALAHHLFKTFVAMSAFLGGGSDIGDLEDRGGVGSGLTASVGVNGEVDAVSRNQTL